ncbi:MAG: CatB-related O-acetyltransferase [Phycisphaerales bacterium]
MKILRTLLGRGPIFYFLRGRVMAWRRLRFGLKHVHPTFYLAPTAIVTRDLVAKEYSFVNMGCMVGAGVEIGRYVMLAPRVAIVGADHRYDVPGMPIIFSGRPALKKTIIEDDAWIGYGAIIMQGVRIGRGAIIAAGAIVTKDVPAYEIHAGIPAKKIGDRFPDPAARKAHDAMLDGPTIHSRPPAHPEELAAQSGQAPA